MGMKFCAFSWVLKNVSFLLTFKQAMTVHITVVYLVRALLSLRGNRNGA